jgi:hypothetical protein
MNLLLYLILMYENYKKKKMISRYETDRRNHHSFDGVTWFVVIKGVTKDIYIVHLVFQNSWLV